ncbi:MAG: SdpI family protein [Ferruginibacter sp.]
MEKFLKKIIWLILSIPAIYLAIQWNSLPALIGIHYDLEGNIDRYGDKTELLTMILVLTAINVAVYLLLPNIYRIDPKKNAAENKSRLYRITFATVVFITAVLCMIINISINGNIQANGRFIIAGVGLLFTVIGNYMYTIKPNYFAGFRLPWTLNNDENWRLTHLLGGKLFFGGGLLIAVCSLFSSFIVSIIVLFITITVIVVITCVYSYRLYKKRSISTGS